MLDLRALGQERGIAIISSGHHHCHEGWLQLHCPFCSPGSGYHLGFSLERGNFHCWRCGSHRTWDVLVRLLGSDAAARAAWGKYHTEPEHVLPTKKLRKKTAWVPPGMGLLGKQHVRYLRERRFDPEHLVKEWGIRGTSFLSGREWNWRVCFPIQDHSGRIVAYGGRAIGNEVTPKYRLPPDERITCDPKSLLYGIHRAKGDAVVIVEGPADVWRLGEGAVATLGTGWHVEQAVQLRTFSRRFVMYDPEPLAQQRATELAEWLGMYSGETEVIEGMSSDPGDLPQDEADQIMRELIHG